MSGNGGAKLVLPGLPTLGESEKACVELLEETLDLAKDGRVSSVAIIVCMAGGFATVMAGKQAGDLHLGAACLQDDIKAAIKGGNVAKRKSGIIRVER